LINKILNNQINKSNKHLEFYNLIKDMYKAVQNGCPTDPFFVDQYNDQNLLNSKQYNNIDNYYIE